MSAHPSYIIGIDLGTTNCALAYAALTADPTPSVSDFAIPQLTRPGEVAAQSLLPSCLYVPGEHELPAGSTRLPWGQSPAFIAGEFARWQGARVPGRLVASAKSWLCHSGVDRTAPILPRGAPGEVAKISPVEASTHFLAHLAAAWNHAHPQAPLAEQEVVITVPASFDEAARALTAEAARRAGFQKFTLVEEPQAAFYDFISHHQRDLADLLKDARLILVVDVGGGTTDFTLIQAGVSPQGPILRRLAVSDHLMLGGDNMDAALARQVEARLIAGGRKLSATQWTQLNQAARLAKESLLGPHSPERYPIAIAAEGSRLLGGTLSAEVQRAEAERLILDGFFPSCSPEEMPHQAPRAALQELGLPYAQDPAVTRHLAAFLRQHARAGGAALGDAQSPLPRPDAVLLNGGVFNSPQITDRLLQAASSWWPEQPPLRLLPHTSLEVAVARGAACYGLVRRGIGWRIGGGSAQAFYVGLASGKEEAKPSAVCLIPRGHEEGHSVDLDNRPFTLMLGRPVQFPLYSTTADRLDQPGDVVEVDDDAFRALPPIHTLFKGAGAQAGLVPVHLRATLTELGTLELWCVANESEERWRLEFELRGTATRAADTVIESMPPRFAEAQAAVERLFSGKPTASPKPAKTSGHHPASPPVRDLTLTDSVKEVKQLFRTLERIIGPREHWRLSMLRELWSALYAGAQRRRRSADHERVFYQLLGYSLRPGFGYPLDDWRCESTFQLFPANVNFHAEQPVWNEFWVMWRRMAGGLDETQQSELWRYLEPHLARKLSPTTSKNMPKPKGVQPQGLEQMACTAASLEHLNPDQKTLLGNWIIERLKNPATAAGPWAWALGRVGARAPIHGSGHKTVSPEQAAAWLTVLLELDLGRIEGAPFAAVLLARLTGDRARDLDDDLRARLVAALTAAQAPERWLRMVTEVIALETTDQSRALGDTLPIGLRMQQ